MSKWGGVILRLLRRQAGSLACSHLLSLAVSDVLRCPPHSWHGRSRTYNRTVNSRPIYQLKVHAIRVPGWNRTNVFLINSQAQHPLCYRYLIYLLDQGSKSRSRDTYRGICAHRERHFSPLLTLFTAYEVCLVFLSHHTFAFDETIAWDTLDRDFVGCFHDYFPSGQSSSSPFSSSEPRWGLSLLKSTGGYRSAKCRS